MAIFQSTLPRGSDYIEEAEYTRDDESEDWEFFAGSNYYEREADNTPMSDKGKRSL